MLGHPTGVFPAWGSTRLTLAALMVSVGGAISSGLFIPFDGPLLLEAAAPLLLLLASLALALGWPPSEWLESRVPSLVPALLRMSLVLGATIELAMFSAEGPSASTVAWQSTRALLVVALAGAALWAYAPNWRRPLFPLLVALALLARAGQIWSVPAPGIDVYHLLVNGSHLLLQGRDPMAATAFSTGHPGVAPYPYWPAIPLLTTPATALLGDPRWSEALGTLILPLAALRLARGASQGQARTLALITLYLPGVLLVLLHAWVESLMIGLIALALLLSGRRRPSGLAQALAWAGLWASKPSALLLALPLARRLGWRLLLTSGGLAAAALLLFWVWDPASFWRGPVLYQLNMPGFGEALTVGSLLHHVSGHDLPGPLMALFSAALVLLLARRADATWAGALGAAGATQVGLFVFNKWGFANYYFLAGALLWLAAAAALGEEAERSSASIAGSGSG